jgi:hypothetical protein
MSPGFMCTSDSNDVAAIRSYVEAESELPGAILDVFLAVEVEMLTLAGYRGQRVNASATTLITQSFPTALSFLAVDINDD